MNRLETFLPPNKLRKTLTGTAVAIACLGVATPADAAPSRPNTKPGYSKSVLTVKGAIARIGRMARNGEELSIEDRYDVLQHTANPNNIADVTTCKRRRVVAMAVSGYINYFGLEAKNPNARYITSKSLEVVPLGGASEVDRTRNPEKGKFAFVGSGTSARPKLRIELNSGVVGTWATASGNTTNTVAESYEPRFVPIAQNTECLSAPAPYPTAPPTEATPSPVQ